MEFTQSPQANHRKVQLQHKIKQESEQFRLWKASREKEFYRGAVVGDDYPGCTVIGSNNVIGYHAVLGVKCQDLKYKESSREVRAIVDFLKPEAVFLELCSSWVTVLTLQNLKVPTMREIVTMLKKKHNMFEVLYGWFLAKIASKLEVFPGSEFRVACEEAIKYGGSEILGDRPVLVGLSFSLRETTDIA